MTLLTCINYLEKRAFVNIQVYLKTKVKTETSKRSLYTIAFYILRNMTRTIEAFIKIHAKISKGNLICSSLERSNILRCSINI